MVRGTSLKLFKVFGISIEINISWVVIFAIVALALTQGYFPSVFPGQSVTVYLIMGLSTTFLFFSSIILHELSHSYVAIKNGIQIRRITLFIFGGVSEMAGEPPDPGIELKMAIAGPGMSFLLAIIFSIISFTSSNLIGNRLLAGPFTYLAIINGSLGLFNLLPGFPLDGGRVLRSIIWLKTKSLRKSTEIAAKSGEGLAVLFTIFGIYLIFLGLTFNGIWIILIGWFLGQAAVSSLQQTKITEALTNMPVSAIMSSEIMKVPADLSAFRLVHENFLPNKTSRYFVEKNGKITGFVTLSDVNKVPHENWQQSEVESIMQSIDSVDKISSESPAMEAMNKLVSGSPQIVVFDGDTVVGIVTRNDLIRLMEIRDKLGI